MKCSSCGADNKEGAKFCKQCGSALSNDSNNATTKSNKNTLIICATAIICVLIVAGALLMMSGNDSTDDSTVPLNDSEEDDSSVEVTESSSSSNNNRYENFSVSEWSQSSYTINDIYTAHTPEDAKTKMFEQADANGDGILTGDEIKEMDYLLKHSEYTWNGPGDDTSASSSSSSDKHWYGECTTHGWVMLNSDKHCPYCIEEGLDPRVLKNSIVYE